ncbi:hypothetical protein BDF20DRAFT_835416 [Mycotypha africana]|uniref:uncharacterized protein n=1 Tax=Mycotypha africana TaxID=64632 RepID=UPI0023009BBC|nr:uncharacterized protein BDF20DRAFT_835416 [Mycotypha africana]KAI8979387.1 hypothetical protein BDF20DRAFT_835416 [Mycotypha africana]
MTQPVDNSILTITPAIKENKQTTRTHQQPSIASRRNSFDIDLEDGPLFRATIKEHEGKTNTLKGHLKRILKAAQALSDTKYHLLEQDRLFIEALREAPFTEPLFTHYLDFTWEKLHEQQERLYICMQNILIDPLQKLYEMDIKSVDTKRKRFEEVSKDYYSALAKYLSKKAINDAPTSAPLPSGSLSTTKNSVSTAQQNSANGMTYHTTIATTSKSLRQKRNKRAEFEFNLKKSEFDLVRFEYYSFLRDLHGGKKEQEILYHLLNHHEKQYSYFQSVGKILEPHKKGLETLARMIAEASKEQKLLNQERDEIRKALTSKNFSNNNASDTSNSSGINKQEPKRKSFMRSISPPLSSMTVLAFPKVDDGLASASSPTSPEITQTGQPFFADYNTSTNSIVDSSSNNIDSSKQSQSDKFKGIRDLEQQDHSLLNSAGRKKEGFLFATSKPIKNIKNNVNSSIENVTWHKYWCVVSGGQLHEHSKWKKHLETHLEPIDLRFATVRKNRNVERRFCFEVITPKFKRLYQATSEEELQSWIATINNAINSLLNETSGTSAYFERLNETSKKSWKQTASFSGALSGLAAAKKKYLKKRSDSSSTKRRVVYQYPNSQYPASPSSAPPLACLFDQNEALSLDSSMYKSKSLAVVNSQRVSDRSSKEQNKLLELLQEDPSNHECADCSAKDPKWCSINLGILLCIECSGIHRSLGTHISKVRSLTLDTLSFTPEITQLMLSLGNAKSNEIWEAELFQNTTTEAEVNTVAQKPMPTSSRDTKLAYIQLKYVTKAFVTQTESIDPMEILYDAIADDDISLAMYAIAIGADVNKPFPASCYSTHSPISLLSPSNKKQPSFITLPSFDADGNVKGTISVPYPSIPLDAPEGIDIDTFFVRYPLHLALIDFEDQKSYPMAEFLLLNGASVTALDEAASGCRLGDLIAYGELIEDNAIAFLNNKNSLRGDSLIKRTSTIAPTTT